jgi:hypothetical protein
MGAPESGKKMTATLWPRAPEEKTPFQIVVIKGVDA